MTKNDSVMVHRCGMWIHERNRAWVQRGDDGSKRRPLQRRGGLRGVLPNHVRERPTGLQEWHDPRDRHQLLPSGLHQGP